MANLLQVVYASTAVEHFGKPELVDMLKGSVCRNKRAGITGLLLFRDGCFMQVLEGEEQTVKALFTKIRHDPRHHNVISLLQEPIEERSFPNSAMAFRDLDSPELRELPGYSEFLNTPLDGECLKRDLPKCQRLVLCFKKNIH
ncbi:MAG TPA: BLUF domain-containing protein [Verrucomicrobiae bacterium]|nr:BLUF domain-containing protein [Verrucomicrobiae bacterium]